jgi:hypothetical protein
VIEDADDEERNREQNGRNAQRMANAIHWMLMTGSILRDPLFVAPSA